MYCPETPLQLSLKSECRLHLNGLWKQMSGRSVRAHIHTNPLLREQCVAMGGHQQGYL